MVPWSLKVVIWSWAVINATRQSLLDSFPIAVTGVMQGCLFFFFFYFRK